MANNTIKNIEIKSQHIGWHGNLSTMINIATVLYDRADCSMKLEMVNWSRRTCMYVFYKAVLQDNPVSGSAYSQWRTSTFLRFVALFTSNFTKYGNFGFIILAWILIISEWTIANRTALSYRGYGKCICMKQKKFLGLP